MSGAPATTNRLYEEVREQAAPTDAAAFECEISDATEMFLLMSQPLIGIARGEKREALAAGWRRLASANARRRLRDFKGPAPTGRRGVLLAMHRAVLDLCQANGVGGVELTSAYNELVDNPAFKAGAQDEKARLNALLALMIVEGNFV